MFGEIIAMMIPLSVLFGLLAVGAYFSDNVMSKYPKIQTVLCKVFCIDEALLVDDYIYEDEED